MHAQRGDTEELKQQTGSTQADNPLSRVIPVQAVYPGSAEESKQELSSHVQRK